MTVAYRYHPSDLSNLDDQAHVLVVMKGAFERVFERCETILFGQKSVKITADHRKDIMSHYEKLAAQGLRVLTLCGKKMSVEDEETVQHVERDDLERNMAFLGLAGI